MDFDRKVTELDVNDILPNRFQPRIKFNEESINELCDSIREHGVIQPIVVRKMGDKYEIIAGERRFKASLLAGKNSIPAVITELNDKDSAEIALIENVQRRDLTPIEEAISYKKILDMGYLTQDDLAIKLGKTQSTVANKLRLLNLSEEVQEALLEEKISERHARSLLRLTNHSDQMNMLNRIIMDRLTVRKADDEIAKILKGNTKIEQPLENTIIPFMKDNNVSFMANPNLNDTSYYHLNDNNQEISKKPIILEESVKKEIPENPFLQHENIVNDFETTEEVVPSFEGNENTFIPEFKIDENINEDLRIEEPIIIIEEEPVMNNNNNQFNNYQNGSYNQPYNNAQYNQPTEFNPFDMANSSVNNDFGMPLTPIEESPQMGNPFQQANNDFVNVGTLTPNSLNIEEPLIKVPTVDNTVNPGFMDIDKIQNEAMDINPVEQMVNTDFASTNTNDTFNVFPTDEPVLRPVTPPINSVIEDEKELKPGKFFHLPIEEEENKNEEIKLDTNPFEFNVNGDPSNLTLNMQDQPKLKSLDEISQFSDSYGNENLKSTETQNQFFQPMMNQQTNFVQNENPINQFGLPVQPEFNEQVLPVTPNPTAQGGYSTTNEFNFGPGVQIQPTQTFIPPMEQPAQQVNSGFGMMNTQTKDINAAMSAIKECVFKIKGLGFNVNTEDFDFENMYQIMFRIEK